MLNRENVEIVKIEILSNFSFFEIDKNYTDKIIDGFFKAH
ncbi:MAG: DbpA RNA binding domain-containing protein [Flavobacteriaceae bacterium]|nr:DbpA RNA binding domain-containing protein [Flavobacteriaceae bacterium]